MAMTEPAPTGRGIRLTARLPKEVNRNGLTAIVDDLIEEPHKYRLAVVVFDVSRQIVDMDEGATTSVVQLLRVEPLDGKAETVARKLLAEAASRRTGDQLSLDSFEEWAAGTDDGDDE